MKTAIIIIIVIISVALLITGILYGEHPHSHHVKTDTPQKEYINQFPEQIPDVVVEPMCSLPSY